MVKRFVILSIILILSAGIFLVGCGNSAPAQTQNETPTPTTQFLGTPDTASPTENETAPEQLAQPGQPRTLEKDVPQVWGKGVYSRHPERKEAQTLSFSLEVGDRVEGEVAAGDVSSRKVMAFVTGPDGAVIRKTDTIVVDEKYNLLESIQEYPWEFSFTANAAGEYMLEINTEWALVEKPVMAHLKVTIFTD